MGRASLGKMATSGTRTTAGQAGGASKLRRRTRAKTEKDIETNLGEELTDLSEPAATAGTPRVQGQGASDSIPEYKQTAFTQTSKGKTLTKKINELTKLQLKATNLSKEKRKEFLSKNKDKMDGLQAAITDMKRRGIDKKKAGGKVMKRKAGGRLKNVPTTKTGLAKLPTNVRNKMGYAKSGGKVSDTKNAKPKDKPTPPIDKGAVERGNRMSKMEAGSAKAMNNKMGGGQVMKYKKGGMVYMQRGGVIKASNDGDNLVASCYKNDKKSTA